LIAAVYCLVLVIRQRRFLARPIVILGSGPMACKVIEEVDSSDDGCHIAGVIDYAKPVSDAASTVPWLGTFDGLSDIIERIRPSRIVVALEDRRGRLPLVSLLESRMRGVIVEDALDFYEHLTGKMAIEALTPGTLILSKGFRHDGPGQLLVRAVSMSVAVLALVVLAPILVLVALAIKLDSRGPVFFSQERSGWGGQPFHLLKFRTMHPSEARASEWVQDNEGRITRLGKWLRRCRFDEIPQMVNVLRGEMNLIGPRPHPVTNQEIFMANIAYYGLRSTVRPGITGWAQVRYGYANNLAEETEKMRYDLYYIKNHTLWLDLKIMLETFVIMLSGHGATEVRRQVRREEAAALRARLADAPVVQSRPATSLWPWVIQSERARQSIGRQ
jgi:exopolysaccharide biosynthesis polyprenyl glycosylphosphotransferase